jgi:6,7-dimethyl-8-ribityllumazine synthase
LAGVTIVDGGLSASGLRFGIVVSRFNAFITERLLEGAVGALTGHGANAADITVARVPGAWEIPQAAAKLVERDDIDAVITLGCLMRGDTIHFDLIAGECARGLGALSRGDKAVVFGVLTTDTLEQAIHRAGGKHGNKGAEVALAAIEQTRVVRALGAARPSAAASPRASAARKKTR